MKTYFLVKKSLKDTFIINKFRTHPFSDKFSTNRNFPRNLTYKPQHNKTLNHDKYSRSSNKTFLQNTKNKTNNSNRNSHKLVRFPKLSTLTILPDDLSSREHCKDLHFPIGIKFTQQVARTREKAGDSVTLDDEWKLARLEIFKVVVARCCEPWVLRSRRGWDGGRAHGRAPPPLPKGTYISWLAAGVTRSYNTIASASSATRHASSSEYSSLSLFFALIRCL